MLDEIVKIEKKLFPKHESLAKTFDDELKKKNTGLLYLQVNGEVAGYAMFSWPSSLCASITKLAGFIIQPMHLIPTLKILTSEFFKQKLELCIYFLSWIIAKLQNDAHNLFDEITDQLFFVYIIRNSSFWYCISCAAVLELIIA